MSASVYRYKILKYASKLDALEGGNYAKMVGGILGLSDAEKEAKLKASLQQYVEDSKVNAFYGLYLVFVYDKDKSIVYGLVDLNLDELKKLNKSGELTWGFKGQKGQLANRFFICGKYEVTEVVGHTGPPDYLTEVNEVKKIHVNDTDLRLKLNEYYNKYIQEIFRDVVQLHDQLKGSAVYVYLYDSKNRNIIENDEFNTANPYARFSSPQSAM